MSVLQMLYVIYIFSVIFTCLQGASFPNDNEEFFELVDEEYNNIFVPFKNCSFATVNPKIVINPYKEKILNHIKRKPFGTFYLKCAACLAVADEIVKTLKESIDTIPEDETNIENINNHIATNLNLLSTKGFKNYGLKKFNGKCLLTNRLDCTEHILTDMDGSWTKKLREITTLFLTYMDMNNILNDVVEDINSLPQKLCRGSGIFRDCVNVDSEEYIKLIKSLQGCHNRCCRPYSLFNF